MTIRMIFFHKLDNLLPAVTSITTSGGKSNAPSCSPHFGFHAPMPVGCKINSAAARRNMLCKNHTPPGRPATHPWPLRAVRCVQFRKNSAVADGIFNQKCRPLADLKRIELCRRFFYSGSDPGRFGTSKKFGPIQLRGLDCNPNCNIPTSDFFAFAFTGMGDGQAHMIICHAKIFRGLGHKIRHKPLFHSRFKPAPRST